MEKRIELMKRGRDPGKITEFVLDNCQSTNIVGLTDEFVALRSLSLINVGLTSLKGFPKLLNLRKLELSDNKISGGLELLQTSPNITHLNLSGNEIRDLDALQPLKEFKNLKVLDLFNNVATNIDNYREKIFNLIPSLRCLDGFDMDDCEVDDSENDDDEVNGNDGDGVDDDSEEVSDEEDDFEEDDFDDEDVGLEAVFKNDLEDDSDEEDYMGEEDEEDEEYDDIDDNEDEVDQDKEVGESIAESSLARGKKRKHEDGGESEN